MLINRNTDVEEEIRIYDNEGIIPKGKEEQAITEYWLGIYQRQENKILSEFNREDYKNTFNNIENTRGIFFTGIDISSGNIEHIYEERIIPAAIAEHLEMTNVQVIRNKPRINLKISELGQVEES